MKNININSKKVKNKNNKYEINKINYKKNNDKINKSKSNYNTTKDRTSNNISSKISNIQKKNNLMNKYNQNIILINHYNVEEKNLKTKKNIIRPITHPNEKNIPSKIKSSENNIKNKLKILNDAHNFFSKQKESTFSNFNINKIIPKTNPRSVSKSPKRNRSANPKHNNKDQLKLIETMQKNQIKQYQNLTEFYQKEKEIIETYCLFSFPEIKYNNKLNIKNNAQIPLEYFGNFLNTYCKEEKTLEFQIIPNFIENQKEINNRMRAIVVNWMIDVHDRFKLLPDTLFLSVIFFDRYMSEVKDIKKEKLQLIGVTSLLIACKYEEIFSPEIRDFVCILDRTFEREDLIGQENYMLKILKFEITFPTSLRYYEILRIEFDIEDKYYNYGIYLLTLILIDSRFSKYTQAVIATTVCFLLKKIFYQTSIKDFMGKFVKIKEDEIKNCLIDICFLLFYIDNSIYTAVDKKFKKIANEIKYKVFNLKE